MHKRQKNSTWNSRPSGRKRNSNRDVSAKTKKKFKKDPTQLLKQCYEFTMKQTSTMGPSYASTKRLLYRARRKELPPIPRYFEINLRDRWRAFFAKNDQENDILRFATDKALEVCT